MCQIDVNQIYRNMEVKKQHRVVKYQLKKIKSTNMCENLNSIFSKYNKF